MVIPESHVWAGSPLPNSDRPPPYVPSRSSVILPSLRKPWWLWWMTGWAFTSTITRSSCRESNRSRTRLCRSFGKSSIPCLPLSWTNIGTSWSPREQPLTRCLSPSPETQAASLRNPQTLPLCSSLWALLLHGVAAPWHLNKDQFWLWWSSWLIGSSLVPIPESWRQLVPFPSALLPKYGLEDQTP